MNTWSPKAHGFESGEAGTRSFNKTSKPYPKFENWIPMFLGEFAKLNVKTERLPDKTIIARKDGRIRRITLADQEEIYWNWVELNYFSNVSNVVFEEAAGLA